MTAGGGPALPRATDARLIGLISPRTHMEVSDPMTPGAKSLSRLRFLKDVVSIRRQRLPCYTDNDKVLWFAELPRDRQEYGSPLLYLAV